VSISITVRSGTGWRRDRDIDNIVKPTLDWLVRWCVIADDNCGIVRHIEVSYDMMPISAACVQIVISRHGS
jgi:Holliday junction resolvase RusA-like endonuclease